MNKTKKEIKLKQRENDRRQRRQQLQNNTLSTQRTTKKN